MRRLARVLAALLLLPVAASAAVVLAMPPLVGRLPVPVAVALRPVTDAAFALVARLPPGSPAGRAFHGSYEALVPLFGANALAVHAALLALPWVALVWLLVRPGAPAPR